MLKVEASEKKKQTNIELYTLDDYVYADIAFNNFCNFI